MSHAERENERKKTAQNSGKDHLYAHLDLIALLAGARNMRGGHVRPQSLPAE